MIILHVIAPGEVGGLERVTQALAVGHRALGHDVHVAMVLDHPGEHPLMAPLSDAGVAVHPVVLPPRAYWLERSRIAALCQDIAPNVVHTHGYRPDVVDSPVARRYGAPTLTTVHGFTRGGWKNWAYEALQRAAFRRFELVVTVSRPLADELVRAGVPAARVRLVLNAWWRDAPPLESRTARWALGVADDRFHIGWVGRLSWEKGADVFLDAITRLTDLPLAVSILGDGIERRRLEGRARRLGISGCIKWFGNLPQAARLFPAFDAFVLSSRTEGSPIVLFEAMAAGVPVVATAVGGVPDILSEGEAVLIPSTNPPALAEAVRAIYRAPSEARARVDRARLRLSDFDVGPWLRRYEEIYQSVGRPAVVRSARSDLQSR